MGYDELQRNADLDHLRILSIFHFVLAAMVGLVSLFPILHLLMGLAMVSGVFDELDSGHGPPAFLGWMLVIFPLVIIFCGLTFAIFLAVAGRRLTQRTSYTFCLVMAGCECLLMPLGTVLGVFTILVLMRPSVKELFDVGTNPFE